MLNEKMLISFSGHLTNGDVNVPSQDIANCISKFLSCTDDKSEGDLMKTSNNCYHDFQSCSGSDIEISEGRTNYLPNYFHHV